ncbi:MULTISPECIES: class I SAM-dependent DNA methyltransferase [Mycobacteriaceae]|jgi:type I restriction enzyme M protein|uniref:site-specific DNA-methyltransferase (adenine-specific) n=2 Tax=Mycolicibacterium TaxID=1866885 RepID=A0A7I7ZY44_9MYCO|nr:MULTISPECIES: class I SAM-dependent DNA methyltransferase [Mycolicibacterium]TDK86157.1 SAM-dependent DNA methyltransferase [Mycolicibacterium mucogenicum]TLH64819.1 DNA methyltransferase [Mycolicibacterium phocaicum]BBZ58347.1 DNA methyltransferase [Mycolicibacterium phocaicum]
MSESRRLVDKLWSYCNVLRDDGVGVIEYTEQLTYLLFLKMAHERATRRLNPQKIVPNEFSWQKLLDAEGTDLEVEYTKILVGLGQQPGTLGTIYRKAQNRIQDPAKLKRLIVDLIDKENWSASGTDLKGDAYEELLAKGASDKGSGAGQYFTPRDLIRAIVDVIDPSVADTVVDPACGTGGFLLVAHEHVAEAAGKLTPTQRAHLRDSLVAGYELVDGTARLAAMNLLLHGIGAADGASLIEVRDALIADPGRRWSVVLSNPPFGRKSSLSMIGADGREVRDDIEIERQDFVVTTSNKQLNFLQHIMTILDINGRAAVVLPDNVLFEGGAGETLRRKLLADFELHTMLRLPTGIFYAQGVKANVLFFDKKPASEHPWTSRLWVYDLRTNQHFTLKQNPLRRIHLDDFVESYLSGKPRDERVESTRWHAYSYDDLLARDKVNLDITWLRDESLEDANNLPAPEVIAREIVEDLTAALAEFEAVVAALEASAGGEDL